MSTSAVVRAVAVTVNVASALVTTLMCIRSHVAVASPETTALTAVWVPKSAHAAAVPMNSRQLPAARYSMTLIPLPAASRSTPHAACEYPPTSSTRQSLVNSTTVAVATPKLRARYVGMCPPRVSRHASRYEGCGLP